MEPRRWDCRQRRTLCQLGGRGVEVDEGLQEKVRLVKDGERRRDAEKGRKFPAKRRARN